MFYVIGLAVLLLLELDKKANKLANAIFLGPLKILWFLVRCVWIFFSTLFKEIAKGGK